jgi:hypothetical protein
MCRRVDHHLESKSFEMYIDEDFLELCHIQCHASLGPYEHTVGLPHQTGTNIALQTFHDLRGLVILMLEIMKLNSTVTYKVDSPLAAMIWKHILRRPNVKIWIYRSECNPNACVLPEPPLVRDILVLCVWAHDLEHRLLGLRPSGNTCTHLTSYGELPQFTTRNSFLNKLDNSLTALSIYIWTPI